MSAKLNRSWANGAWTLKCRKDWKPGLRDRADFSDGLSGPNSP